MCNRNVALAARASGRSQQFQDSAESVLAGGLFDFQMAELTAINHATQVALRKLLAREEYVVQR
jgi:hypothetical protein